MSGHVISLYLANWQVDATTVSSLEEAETCFSEAAASQPFDAVILDVRGFGDRAIEFARSIRATTGDRRTEVILLVGLDSYMADSSLETLDATAILAKPVRPSELFNALVSIASDGAQRNLMPHFKRRKVQTERPNFAARILVAEDNAVNQEVATAILEMMGCRIVTAPNGRTAVRLFAEEKFDLILMDCEMPIMDGIEATRRIREIETMSQALPDASAPRRTPIIALTAHALNDVRGKCLEAGMDDFLVKPFDDRQMATTLLRWLVPSGMMAGDDASGAAERPDAQPVIDPTVIEGLRALDRKGGSSRIERAVSRFMEIAPPLATTIHESCTKGDADVLWRAAHSLKSSAGALGAKLLSRRCAEIETRAREAGAEEAKSLVAGLETDLAAAIAGLKALIGETHAAA